MNKLGTLTSQDLTLLAAISTLELVRRLELDDEHLTKTDIAELIRQLGYLLSDEAYNYIESRSKS